MNCSAHNLSFGRKLLVASAAMLAVAGALVIGVLNAPTARAQSAKSTPAAKSKGVTRAEIVSSSAPRFEVASIRVSDPNAPHPGRLGSVQVVTSPGRLTSRNATLNELIKGAYALQDYQISGGPAWVVSPGFDVQARGSDGENRDQLLLMLRALLADRFKLAVHWEAKELPVYALVVAKNGPKFHAAKPGGRSVPTVDHMHLKDLPSLATYLSRLGSSPGQPGRPVLDKTGLTGDFDLDLDMKKVYAALELSGAPPTNQQMYEATVNLVRDDFGLKLESQKGLVDVLVIDRAEKPSEN